MRVTAPRRASGDGSGRAGGGAPLRACDAWTSAPANPAGRSSRDPGQGPVEDRQRCRGLPVVDVAMEVGSDPVVCRLHGCPVWSSQADEPVDGAIDVAVLGVASPAWSMMALVVRAAMGRCPWEGWVARLRDTSEVRPNASEQLKMETTGTSSVASPGSHGSDPEDASKRRAVRPSVSRG